MAVAEITDHVARMLGWALSQFDETPMLRAVLEAIGVEVQAAETTLFDLYADRLLSTAVGAQLDQYGAVLAFPRAGLTDSDYRLVLLAKIRAHRASGRPEEIVAVVATVVAPFSSQGVRYVERPPSGYTIAYVLDVDRHTMSDELRAALVRLIREMKPAGIELDVKETLEPGAHGVPAYFTTSIDPDPDAVGVNESGQLTTRRIYPAPALALVPTSGLVAGWSPLDERTWAESQLTDGLRYNEVLPFSGAPSSASKLYMLTGDDLEYSRRGGHVRRGSFVHSSNTTLFVPDVPTIPAATGFTIHARAKCNASGLSLSTLVAQSGNDADPSEVTLAFSEVFNGWGLVFGGVVTNSPLVASYDTEWHEVTAMYDPVADETYLWIDRELVASESVAEDVSQDHVLVVGSDTDDPGDSTSTNRVNELDGEWSALFVYGRAQTEAEITATWAALDQLDGVLPATL